MSRQFFGLRRKVAAFNRAPPKRSIFITNPMRRIPRPQRAIDPSLPVPSLIQRRTGPSQCLRAAAAQSHLRTTSACFSTTPTFNFLLGGKQDKKKHQAFVRRWQKRILGDSEPIGAHVDPYDPSSPVRIAPEEQGEEVEVLEDERSVQSARKQHSKDERLLKRRYKEATEGPLLHVGGKEWIEQAEEVNMAKEFEKLTMRTYTPMTQEMADQIENLTGTYYTLRDENLMMAQTFDEATGKPYTDFSFGRQSRVTKPEILRENFHQAVVEVHALKQAGKDLDISKQANRGIYDIPTWINDIQLQRNGEGEFILSFPPGHSLEALLAEMERVPDYEHPAGEAGEVTQDELLAEEGESVTSLEPPPPPPIMDPATPAFKKAALVKDDAEKPKFDFMSNRPVPRNVKTADPVAPVVEVKQTVQEVVLEKPVSAVPAFDFDAALATSSTTLNELRHAVLESAARSSEQSVSAIRDALRDSITSASSKIVLHVEPNVQVKWQHVPLTDSELKFALSKRFTQLTGHYISDPQLTSSKHLGDLYHHICGSAKPTTTDVYSYIHTEGTRQNTKINQLMRTHAEGSVLKVKAPVTGELLKARNVQLLKKNPTKADRRVELGLNKVVRREMISRGLLPDPEKQRTMKGLQRPGVVKRRKELERMTGLFREFKGQDEDIYLLRKRANKN
ncbi:uncharacterized protein N0V89_008220 [Didymosphaeria variabile]|uniref:Large ribosomal subunit protein mL50 n=1 Tax=Didymosphaeria variabile TaxID=1932322 RepID=A0A9W8XH68_9PLEO|nr:uncharacterized protein N0V89_008220 [Didymosphaeria variabile]KAJ4349604.1 hypothetical protein N0V89_008220 [Didymosphaeria variabile]